MMERTDCPSFQIQIAMDPTADLDSAFAIRVALTRSGYFQEKFSIHAACFLRGRSSSGPFWVPSSSAAAEAMLTEPPMLSDADHCTNITAARAQLKDKGLWT
ncbi:hypothetical protein CDAR_70441 [Caerostris darwini]|uniref:Uncharacterized protein n=1 Tax=Caerostris darwini TaxID=1538125 RepID=A0AAV4Q5G8_9ARAC|nr:hypothetical protein CDAR_70441 [Caerostris darwini]